MDEADQIETKQKINIVKNFIKRFDSANKQNIEKQLQTHGWIIKLIEDQLQKDKTFYTFGEKFRKSRIKKKDELDSNVTLRKRKLFPLTLEERLKDSPNVFAEIPANRVKGIEAAIPPESLKNLKLITIKKIMSILLKQTKMKNQYNEKNKIIQNLFRNLQKDSKSVFNSISNLSRALLNKAKKSTYGKDIVHVINSCVQSIRR